MSEGPAPKTQLKLVPYGVLNLLYLEVCAQLCELALYVFPKEALYRCPNIVLVPHPLLDTAGNVHSALYPTRKTVLHGTQEKLYYTSRYTGSFPAVTPLGSNWADCGHNSAPPLLTIIRRSSLRYRYWEGRGRMLADRAKENDGIHHHHHHHWRGIT